jgi:selenide,water dikinase
MQATTIAAIEKNVVLVGAGNAHLRFIKMFAMKPMPGVAVTLVSDAAVVPYSAMVPGHIGGDHALDAIRIDLVRLCRASGVRLVVDRAERLDIAQRKVRFAGRPELSYDVLSLGLGSLPSLPAGMEALPNSWQMRPLGDLIERLDALRRQLQQAPRPFHLAVVGGGASGCELTLAIRKRFEGIDDFRMTLLQNASALLPQFPAKAGRIFQTLLGERRVEVRLHARVVSGDEKGVDLADGERLPCDAVLWATNAAPHAILRTSGLKLNAAGFLQVGDTLQSIADPAVFGTGDCIELMTHPDLPKNGVAAVRQGGVLFENVGRFLLDKPLQRFRPQCVFLCLLNTSDEQAVFCYGPLVWKARWARWLKDRIDVAWVEKFTKLLPASVESDESPTMRCGGCGNKISSDVLSAVLKRIDVADDPRVLMGCKAGEDASVYRMKPELFGDDPQRLVEVQTVDYFKAFVDDPYLFGRIAALNSVSDLYAMNARPFSALAIATLPYARGPVQEAMLFELLSGAVHSLKEAGVILAGGHTTEGSELALGFAVTGYAEDDRLFQKSTLQEGDLLLLTKPLGSGALLAAWMRGACQADWFAKLTETMLLSNGPPARVLARHGIRACTDVTGFGFAGHLLEMLDGSHLSARLDVRAVPTYPGFDEVVARGIVSSLHRDNAKVSVRINNSAPLPAWLFDPQTAGGLLAGIKREQAEIVLREIRAAGCPEAAYVGEVVALDRGMPPTIHIP